MPLLQRKWFDGVKGLVNSEAETGKAARERFRSANHAMRVMALEFFKHLFGHLGNNTLYALEEDSPHERSSAKQLLYDSKTAPFLALLEMSLLIRCKFSDQSCLVQG